MEDVPQPCECELYSRQSCVSCLVSWFGRVEHALVLCGLILIPRGLKFDMVSPAQLASACPVGGCSCWFLDFAGRIHLLHATPKELLLTALHVNTDLRGPSFCGDMPRHYDIVVMS